MSIIVFGKLIFSNGKPTPHTGGLRTDSNNFSSNVLFDGAGNVTISFIKIDNSLSDDEIFTIAGNVINSSAPIMLLTIGEGFFTIIEKMWRHEKWIYRVNDSIGSNTLSEIDADAGDLKFSNIFMNILGKHPYLRYALKDLNQALIDREDSPMYFYRFIETCARDITGAEGPVNWDSFHKQIGTSQKNMQTIFDFAHGEHRHGTHKKFSSDDHSKMRQEARFFLKKVLSYSSPLEKKSAE